MLEILFSGEKDMLDKSHLMILTMGIIFLVLVLPVTSSLTENTIKEMKHEKQIDKDYSQNCSYRYVIKQVTDTPALEGVSHTPYSAVTSLLVDHQWPQHGYNHQHVGQSPYSTSDNPGTEKWRFPCGWCDGSPVISSDGAIYFGGGRYLYAVNPSGTLNWKFEAHSALGSYGCHPAIADDGTIYIATIFGSYLQAVYPNGTEKWSYGVPEVHTSITIDDDGVIYYGHEHGVDARYPNGTLKWTFHPGGCVYSTPAIDDNGIIYFGSHDFNIYAVYPNGTLKWNYTTNAWVHGSPSIGADGTIYCGSDDYYLYAFYPNGTLQWKTNVGSGMYSSPSQDKDGNLYFGVWHSKIMSVASNGTIRWEFPLRDRDRVWGSTAAISDDGTVYIGNCIDMDMLGGGEIIALDLNGTLKWRKTICDLSLHSSPVIGADGTVYICASNDGLYEAWGYLHAFGPGEPRIIEMESPQPGKWYLFGKEMGSTPQGRTVIIGGTTVRMNVYSVDDLENLCFYIGHEYQYSVTEPPFEWKMNKRYGVRPFMNHALYVIAKYKNGCEYALVMDIWYLHLLKN
jgi:outer membrane protein assembly factor BamB